MDSIEDSKETVSNRLLREAISVQRSDPEKAIDLYAEIRKRFPGTNASELAQAYAYNLTYDCDALSDGEAPSQESRTDSYNAFSGWAPPSHCIGWLQVLRFRALIVLTSLVVSVTVPIPFWGQRIYGFEFMFYFLGITIFVLWVFHLVIEAKSEYWGRVSIAATTLLPVWWFTFITPLVELYSIKLTN